MDFSLENFSMMDFNYFDVTILAIILILGIKGFMQGFIKEFFGLLGLVAGVYFASRFADKAGEFISINLIQIEDPAILKLIGFLTILLIIWIGATFIGAILSKLTSISGLSFINRLLGFIMGGGKYFLIFALIVTALSHVKLVQDNLGKYTKDSVLFPYLQETGSYLINMDIEAMGIKLPTIDTNITTPPSTN
ncbi:MAG: CvpA family protein [Sulfurovum sp.]